VYEPSVARVAETGELVDHKFGVMIETPRACLDAAAIAEDAEFFSFGTNDLTQFAYAFSRDDSAQFFPDYLSTNIMESDPFEHVDQFGVGELAKMALERGRSTRPDLKVGVCGEHGGDPQSVIFWDKLGLADYGTVDVDKKYQSFQTYQTPGLPDWPIASPSAKSIKAALNPDLRKKLLYFYACPGSDEHKFGKNNKQHIRNINSCS
jgi:hypothetical protein